MPLIDLTNQTFGKLKVQRRGSDYGPTRDAQWWCLCECGNQTIVRGKYLKNGHTTSCGCLRAEHRKNYGKMLLGKSKFWTWGRE